MAFDAPAPVIAAPRNVAERCATSKTLAIDHIRLFQQLAAATGRPNYLIVTSRRIVLTIRVRMADLDEPASVND